MNFDVLSFIFGKLNCGSNFNDVVSYLLGKAVSGVWKTITNVAIASFTTVSTVLRELIVDVTPTQSGSGDPYPPGGGKNLVDESLLVIGADYYAPDGTITSNSSIKVAPAITLANGTYTISWVDPSSQYVRVNILDVNGTFIRREITSIISPKTFTMSGSDAKVQLAVDTSVSSVQLEVGATATPYAPYSNIRPISGRTGANIVVSSTLDAQDGTTYAVSWQTEAGTVYGGTLTDNGDGTWTLTCADIIYSLPSVNSNSIVVSSYGTRLFVKYFLPTVATEQGDFFYGERCSWITYADRGEVWKGVIGLQNETLSLFIWIPADSTVESVNTALAGSKIVYPIATPQTYTLAAESVKALLGDNNIFADCGNINTITYRER